MNLKLLFPFFAFIFLLINCSKSNYSSKEINYIPYYLKVYEADSLYITGNYQRSFEILDSLFQHYEPLNQAGIDEMRTYVKSAYLTENHYKLKPYIYYLINKWGFNKNYLEYDSILKLSWSKANLTEKEVEKLELEYQEKINLALRDTLTQMHKADQLYRGKDKDKKIKREDSVDLIHKKFIIKLLKKEELPDRRTLDADFHMGAIFNHISDNVTKSEDEFIKSSLLKTIKKGKSSPDNLSMYLDRQSYDKKEKVSPFGTFNFLDNKLDTIQINKNRKEIGLPSLQYEKFKHDYYERIYGIQ